VASGDGQDAQEAFQLSPSGAGSADQTRDRRVALIADLARIMREEVADVAAHGGTYLKMDEVPVAVLCDPKNQETVRRRAVWARRSKIGRRR